MGGIVTTSPPNEQEFATIGELLAALEYDCDEDDDMADLIEDYVLGYLAEDLGMGLFVDVNEADEAGELSLHARLSFYTDDAVRMWNLRFPVTVNSFHRYLDELDVRVARKRILLELPSAEEQSDDEDDEVSIVEVLSRLFGSSEGEVVGDLGENWRPIVSDAMGWSSKPDRYLLWDDRLVVGLDDQFAHVFVPVRIGDDVEVGDVLIRFLLGEVEMAGVTEFARALEMALGSD